MSPSDVTAALVSHGASRRLHEYAKVVVLSEGSVAPVYSRPSCSASVRKAPATGVASAAAGHTCPPSRAVKSASSETGVAAAPAIPAPLRPCARATSVVPLATTPPSAGVSSTSGASASERPSKRTVAAPSLSPSSMVTASATRPDSASAKPLEPRTRSTSPVTLCGKPGCASAPAGSTSSSSSVPVDGGVESTPKPRDSEIVAAPAPLYATTLE